jgi:hypothetical protein
MLLVASLLAASESPLSYAILAKDCQTRLYYVSINNIHLTAKAITSREIKDYA